MNATERSRMAILDTTLTKRAEQITAADERALDKLRRAGFRFLTIKEALEFQAKERRTARSNAAMASLRSKVAGELRRTA